MLPILLCCIVTCTGELQTQTRDLWPLCDASRSVDQRHIHTNVNRKRQTWTEPESVDAVVIIIIMIKTSEIDVTEKLTFDLFSLT